MSVVLDIPNPYKSGTIFRLTPFRLFGAGPSNSSAGVLNSMIFQPITAFNRTYFEVSKKDDLLILIININTINNNKYYV